jgi:hypothetical protein
MGQLYKLQIKPDLLPRLYKKSVTCSVHCKAAVPYSCRSSPSIYLSINPLTHPPLYPSIYPSIHPTALLHVHPYVYLPTYLSPTYTLSHFFIHRFTYLLTHPPIYTPNRSIHPFTNPFLLQSTCPSTHLVVLQSKLSNCFSSGLLASNC